MRETVKKEVIGRGNTKKGLKRIEILKDAIAQINAEKYAVTEGTYVSFDNGKGEDNPFEKIADTCDLLKPGSSADEKAHTFINQLVNEDRPCEVCAKGSLVISTIRKDKSLTLIDITDSVLDSGIVTDLTDVFAEDNLDLMEAFFEASSHHASGDGGYSDGEALLAAIEEWSDRYSDPKDRLIAIFKNAIKNDGVFKPKK